MIRPVIAWVLVFVGGGSVMSAEPFQPIADAAIRTAATRALQPVQRAQTRWYEHTDCVSCHHQLLPLFPLALAGPRGVAVDAKLAHDVATRTFAYLKDLDGIVQGYDYIDVVFDAWLLVGADQCGVAPNLSTTASAQFIARRQRADGNWATFDSRPPQAHSEFTVTAVCARAVQLYLLDAFAEEKKERLRQARDWFLRTTPRTTEDRTFQLLGLRWTGADRETLGKMVQQLLTEQRADGGWGQLPGLASDAYATGEVLYALHVGGGLPTTDPAYQRGLRFLLDTQEADGSWVTESRLHPMAPLSPDYFSTGFPRGHHQYISISGTSWAAAALLLALPPAPGAPVERRSRDDLQPAAVPSWVPTVLTGSRADLQKLLADGLDPNAQTPQGTTVLMMAVGDLEKVKLLLGRRADAQAEAATGFTALMVASRYRANADVVRLLLKHGAKPGAAQGGKIRNDATALFFAASTGDVAVARTLIDAGARVNDPMRVLGRFSMTPLYAATMRAETSMMDYLLGHGGDANELRSEKISLLEYAILHNHLATVQLLLAKGAHVHHADDLGMTPLHYAALVNHGDTAVVEALLAAGADPQAKDHQGRTAFDRARECRNTPIAARLAEKRTAPR